MSELQKADPPNPLAMLQSAIDKGMNPEQLGKLMDLAERWEKNRAAEAFANAITEFQAECPQIDKWKSGADGKYKYAPYESVMLVAGPLMVKHRIVATFTTEDYDKGVIIILRIRVGIHTEETRLKMPSPQGNKLVSESQIMGMTMSFGKRYALQAALNIVSRDEDPDGWAASVTLTGDQIGIINDLIEKVGQARGKPVDFPKFLAWLNVENLADLPQTMFGAARNELQRQLKEAKK